jgi:urease accessory protein
MNRGDAEAQRRQNPQKRIAELNDHEEKPVDSRSQIPSAPPRLCGDRQWLLWQLADSAFPTGGFAHSAGLEAAWQQGEVRNRVELREWLLAGLQQIGRAALPFVNAAHAEPSRLEEFDRLCDAFTSNHVANRASRLQGRALLVAAERVFKSEIKLPPFTHLAPVFGAVTGGLDVPHPEAVRLFVFTHLRGAIAAAVRLNIVGPMEGQVIQFQLSQSVETVVERGVSFTLDDLAQTAPLLELWQGAHDRLYSRLFQS